MVEYNEVVTDRELGDAYIIVHNHLSEMQVKDLIDMILSALDRDGIIELAKDLESEE